MSVSICMKVPMFALRPLFVIWHRWFGLAAAIFLFISGATGALISWDHELDAALNPTLFHAQTDGKALPGTDLATRIEAQDPRMRVTYMLTAVESEHTSLMSVEGRIDPATGKPFELGFNQVAVDPATGVIQGKRQWGEISLSRENLLPFLYKLHYTMHLPAIGTVELGIWLMGLIAMAWVLDCAIALWLSFPSWKGWRKSFLFRWRAGGHKLTFDLHRSGAVWIWLFLLLLAITSVSMNLSSQVMRPIVAQFSTLTPSAFDTLAPRPPEKPIEPVLTREQAIALASAESARRGWTEPVGGLFYAPAYGLYGVGFFQPGNDHGDVGLGNNWLYFDGRSGAPAGSSLPGTGSAGDIFLQAQFPLHSGRIIGLPGRIMISVMGALVAMLSVTGVLIWARKRKARLAVLKPVPVKRPGVRGLAALRQLRNR
jgi:uncharacterized iron-regulated membrane protein